MFQSSVNSALEARDASDTKECRWNPPTTNQKQTCLHCKKAGQISIHTGIVEDKCFLIPVAMKYRPAWARKKLEEKGIKFKIMWQGVDLGESEGKQDTYTVKNKTKTNLEPYLCLHTPNPL